MTSRLLDVGRVDRWAGSTALAVRDAAACSWCGARYEGVWTEDALFRHGGYGASRRVVAVWCLCGALTARTEITERPPDRRRAGAAR